MIFLAVFFGVFLGILCARFVESVIVPSIQNRREHKRIMDTGAFREQWGRNVISFFVFYGGKNRNPTQ